MGGAEHGQHESLLNHVVGTGDIEARLVPHLSGLRRDACCAEYEDEGDGTVVDRTDAPGVIPVDARSLVTKDGGRRVC